LKELNKVIDDFHNIEVKLDDKNKALLLMSLFSKCFLAFQRCTPSWKKDPLLSL